MFAVLVPANCAECSKHRYELRCKEPNVSIPEAGEVQGLEKATNTSYGKIVAQAGEMVTKLCSRLDRSIKQANRQHRVDVYLK